MTLPLGPKNPPNTTIAAIATTSTPPAPPAQNILCVFVVARIIWSVAWKRETGTACAAPQVGQAAVSGANSFPHCGQIVVASGTVVASRSTSSSE
jgi:hypothetical protein